jgi:hypothetical protein
VDPDVLSFFWFEGSGIRTEGNRDPLSIQFFYSPTMERTFVELFDCSVGPDRLTGSRYSTKVPDHLMVDISR